MAKEANGKSAPSMADVLDKIKKPFEVPSGPPPVKVSVLEGIAAKMTAFGYEFTEETLKILLEYLRGYNLWLCGNVGVGKTFFFDCLNKVRVSRDSDRIVKLSMIETQGWTMEEAAEWARDYADHDVLIDDVGAEPELNHYGQKVELFPYLLEKRMNTRFRTHLTSNLGAKDIMERYEKRVADRFVQMFKMMPITAKKSRRRLSPWVRADINGNGAT